MAPSNASNFYIPIRSPDLRNIEISVSDKVLEPTSTPTP